MNAADSQRLIQHIRRLAGDPPDTPSDGELLRRYLDSRDEAAFAALVRRHGPMVFSVCQSVLRQRHDAEDAFQAAFLILAQKAGSIRRQEGLGGWLQRVTYRVALKARADHLRRQEREAKMARSPMDESSSDELSWGELRAILHAELAALPESLRAPLVLCYLEGLTQEEAARQLGWSLSTVRGRLQRGREKLRRRLERRGVGLAAALGAALTGQALAETSVRALRPFTVETATATAAALAHGFGHALASLKWKALAFVLVSAGLAAGGAGMLSPKPTDEGPKTASADKPAAERPAPRTDLYGDPLPEGAIARMGSIQLRHAGLADFVFLSDGKTVISAGGPVLRFWDLATGKQVREIKLQGAVETVVLATLSPDGKTVAALNQKKISFWEVNTGKKIQSIEDQPENAVYLRFSADGKILAVGGWDGKVTLWEWEKKKERRLSLPVRKAGIDSAFHGCFSPDGKWFVAGGGWFDPLCVYELATLREVHRLNCYASISAISPDSKRLAVASMSGEGKGRLTNLRFFDLAGGKELARYPIALGSIESFFSLAFAPDGKTLACGGSDRCCLVDCASGKVLHRLPGQPHHLAFSPDGKLLVAQTSARLRVWDTVTMRERHERPGEFGSITAAAVSPDGKLLASAGWGQERVNLWDTASGRLLRALPVKGETKYVENLAFSADGKTLLAGQIEGFLRFWNIADGKDQRTVQLRDSHRPNPRMVCFHQLHVSRDGKRVSTLEAFGQRAESTRLALWDMDSGKLLSQHELPPRILHTDVVLESAWSADAATLTLRLNDGLTQMRVESGAIRFRIPATANVHALAASPDGRLLAAARQAGAKDKAAVGIWEAATGKEVATVATDAVSRLALTPDNRHLVTTDRGFLRVWDVATGKERRRWLLPEANTSLGGDAIDTRLLLSPDGRRAFTALDDDTALVWDLQPALSRRKPLAGKLSDEELATCWTNLAADDARRAYTAIWRLTEMPEAAIPFLRQRLQPATDADIKAVRRLLADLDSDVFVTREKAFEQLAKLGPVAEPVLRQAFEQKPALEARRRMQLLLEKIDGQPAAGESLRLLRALQVLENTGAEGRRLLRELASGTEGAWLTREAKAALTRLNRRAP